MDAIARLAKGDRSRLHQLLQRVAYILLRLGRLGLREGQEGLDLVHDVAPDVSPRLPLTLVPNSCADGHGATAGSHHAHGGGGNAADRCGADSAEGARHGPA